MACLIRLGRCCSVAVMFFVTLWTAASQASLSFTISQSLPSNISLSVILFSSCPQSFPASRFFLMSQLFPSGGQSIGASASVLSVNIQDWFFFRVDWFDLLAVQGTLKSLLQHHSLKASVLQCSAFFMVQLSHPYISTGITIALARQTNCTPF